MADSFGSYLADLRKHRVAVVKRNPSVPADRLLRELEHHLKAVARWIDGHTDRKAMSEAMRFFQGRYAGKGWIYRGTGGEQYDGAPKSYTRKRAIAQGFAKANAKPGKPFFVIRRKAPGTSLDFARLLSEYANGGHYRSEEAEVVAFNTKVPAKDVTQYLVK